MGLNPTATMDSHYLFYWHSHGLLLSLVKNELTRLNDNIAKLNCVGQGSKVSLAKCQANRIRSIAKTKISEKLFWEK